ncbi:MAG: alkylphosphonate utilization protein [Simkaniaceae bacterium]|nr:alkylphosphonate utilization protein [Simkaniaceae bacterium]
MKGIPPCIKCGSDFTYEDGNLYICPECGYEWIPDSEIEKTSDEKVVKDAVGNILQDGDSVTIIKDIKVKGSSSVIKVGVKVKSIRIVDEVDGHNIEAKVPGFGPMMLKSEVVKKSG